MSKSSARHIDSLSAKQIIAVLLGPGLFVLAFDSAIEHFVGKGGIDNRYQLIPALFGPLGGLALLALGIRRLRLRVTVVRAVLRVVGALSTVVGLAGGVFHVLPLIEDLKDETLTIGALEGAVGSAPPMFAPLAFAGFGVLLVAVASPRLLVKLRLSSKAPEVSAPVSISDGQRRAG